MGSLMVFTLPQVERLTRLSRRTIVRWQRTGVFFPDYPQPLAIEGPYQRIYSFRDVVGLRTLAELRRVHHVLLSEVRKVGQYLKKYRRKSWSELRFWVIDRHVVFRDPKSSLLISGKDLSQVAIEPIVLEDIALAVESDSAVLREREPETRGKIVRHRNIMSNRPVIDGTRIPTSIIWDFHSAGYSIEEIIAEYPDLTQEDVQAAINHESHERHIAA